MMAYLADIGVLELEVLTANESQSIGRLKVPLRFREVFDRVPQLPQELAMERQGEDGKATIQGDFAVWGANNSEVCDGRKEVVLGSISLALHLRFGQHSLIRQTLQQSKLASASNANNDSGSSSYDCTDDTDLKIPSALGGEDGGASNRGWALAPVMSSFQLHEALVAADINDTLPKFPNALAETAKRPNARSSGRAGQRPRYVPPDARGEATAALPGPASHQRHVPPSQQRHHHRQRSPHEVQHNDVEVKEQKVARLPSPRPHHQANVAKHASHPHSSEEVSSVGTYSRRGSGSAREATYEVASAADPIEIDFQPPTQDDREPTLDQPPPLRPPPSLGEPPLSVFPSEVGSEVKVAEDDDHPLEELLRRGLELRAAIGAAFGPPPPPLQALSGSTANPLQSVNDQNHPPGFLFGGSGGNSGSKEVEPPPQQSSESAQPRQSAHPRNSKLPSQLTSRADSAKMLAGLDASKAAELGGVVEKLRMAGRVPGGGGSVGDGGHMAPTPGGTTMDAWEWAMEEAMVAEEGLADEIALEALLDKARNILKTEHCSL